MTRLLVCGIAVMDFVHRMPSLPVTEGKHLSHGFERIGGGCAANAAVAAARLGGEVTLLSRLGADTVGDDVIGLLAAQGVTPAIRRAGRTPVSSVLIDGAGERMIVNFPGADLPDDPAPVPPADVVLADCRWPAATESVLRAARDRGIPAVLDGEKFTAPALAALASHVVFSAPGLVDFTGEADLTRALAAAARQIPGRVAYTDGARGVVWAAGPHVPAPRITAHDTLGAGDVWHGAFALALGQGRDLTQASTFANAAAALKCSRAGGWDRYPTSDELDMT